MGLQPAPKQPRGTRSPPVASAHGLRRPSPESSALRWTGNYTLSNFFRLARTAAATDTALRVSKPNDPEEIEADHVADAVMRMPADSSAPVLQRKCAACEEEEKRVRRSATAEVADAVSPIVNQALSEPGRPLVSETREFFESRFGMDFSDVRVHDDPTAAASAMAVRAKAYAVGSDVVFADGEYTPQTLAGRHLLAHELAHVAQQTQAGPQVQRQAENGSPPEPPPVMPAEPSQAEGGVADQARPSSGDVVDDILDALNSTPAQLALKAIPGGGAVAELAQKRDAIHQLRDLASNPEAILDQVQQFMQTQIDRVPDKAQGYLNSLLAGVEESDVACVWRSLSKSLANMQANWWQIVKDTAWDLVWPIPGIVKDAGKIWTELGLVWESARNLEFSAAIDHLLNVLQLVNAILGRLSGWTFIALVGGGAVVGLLAGGPAGAAAGAGAGFAAFGSIGEALLAAAALTEAAVIEKARYNLSNPKLKPEQREQQCQRIAGSVLTLGIMGALVLLGKIGERIARGIRGAFAAEGEGAEVAGATATESPAQTPEPAPAAEAPAEPAPAETAPTEAEPAPTEAGPSTEPTSAESHSAAEERPTVPKTEESDLVEPANPEQDPLGVVETDGGKVVVSRGGWFFRCSSPCTFFREWFDGLMKTNREFATTAAYENLTGRLQELERRAAELAEKIAKGFREEGTEATPEDIRLTGQEARTEAGDIARDLAKLEADTKALTGEVPPGTDTKRWGGGGANPLEELRLHYLLHGAEVGVNSVAEYLELATEFADRIIVSGTRPIREVRGAVDNVWRYVREGRYIDMTPDGKTIVSFGKAK